MGDNIDLIVGSPVTGKDFFGRQEELERALALIEHNNLMLAAPRRVGKTSFARKLIELERAKGWNAIFMDLENISDTSEFLKLFKEELLGLPSVASSKKLAERVKALLPSEVSVSVKGVSTKASFKDWQSDQFTILTDILNSMDAHVLIVFDELTVLLESLLAAGENDAKTFLNLLRALRQATSGRCSWLICSSVGVRNFANTYRLSDTLNDIVDFDLGAYREEEAKGLLAALCQSQGIVISEALRDHLLRKIGWNIPFFIQLLVYYLPKGEVGPKVIDATYERVVKTGAFDTWNERLAKEYGANEATAKEVLTYLSMNNGGKSKDAIYNYVLTIAPSFPKDRLSLLLRALETDGYIVREKESYRFRSPLLRDYWKYTFA